MADLQTRIGKILFQHPISEHAASSTVEIIKQCEDAAVAYSEACRRRESERAEIHRRLVA